MSARQDELAPRSVSWEQLTTERFDLAQILPVRPEGADGGADLFLELAALLARRFPAQPEGDELEGLASFADAVRYLYRAPSRSARVGRMRALEDARPALAHTCAPWLAQLALDDQLFDSGWDPDDELDRDGLAPAEPWSRELVQRAPWKGRAGTDSVFQGAALMRADLEAIKAAECDFSAYPRRVGEEYDEVHPLPGSVLSGTDAAGLPFLALSFAMKVPLPFPFGSYEATVHMLNRLDARGRLVTDVYSKSPDFLWLAGRDVCLPVVASDGEWLATLVVRRSGFDLAGVPDGDGDRRGALRAGLGNLKRDAETRFERYGGPARTTIGGMPRFEVE